MRRRAALVAAAVAVIAVGVWFASDEATRAKVASVVGLTAPPPTPAVRKDKPICTSVTVPTGGDCIPQHMAGLPPDPGEAGKATIDGIDADQDGLRDDVQRFIHETWPDSERTRRVLVLVAKSKLTAVHYGGDLSREEAAKFMPEIMRRAVCYSRVGGDALIQQSAMAMVQTKVTNTPERWARAADFSYKLAHNVYELPDDHDIPALCGFDPDSLPN